VTGVQTCALPISMKPVVKMDGCLQFTLGKVGGKIQVLNLLCGMVSPMK